MSYNPPHSSDQSLSNAPGCDLNHFERNLYFHGKLITVRDMQLEQAYHAGRHNTHTRLLHGTGVVCGLDTTTEWDAESRELVVSVSRGMAYDCCGVPIVVESGGARRYHPGEATEVYVFLRRKECFEELVPSTGAENACEDDCEYSHVRETYEIVVETDPPTHHVIPEVSFPTKAEFGDDPVTALGGAARSYYENDPLYRTEAGAANGDVDVTHNDPPCVSCDDPKVFLATFTRPNGESGEWSRTDTEHRSLVYPNKLLYSGLASHAADFGNPHETHLTAASIPSGARVAVNDDASDEGHVDIRSADENLSVTLDGDQIFLSLGDDLSDALADLSEFARDLTSLRRYVMDRSLKCKLDAFTMVAERFGNSSAGGIAEHIVETVEEDGVSAQVFKNEGDYREFMADIAPIEARLGTELKTATTASRDRYTKAVTELTDTLDGGTVLEIAVAQDWVCETAERLERRKSVVGEDSIVDHFGDHGEFVREFPTHGVTTVEEFLARDPDDLADLLDVDPPVIRTLEEEINRRIVEDIAVDEINGIGPEFASDLSNSNIATIGDLLRADLEDVESSTGISSGRLRNWFDRAETWGSGR